MLAAVGEHSAELEVVIVRHRASGWVREIARKSDRVTEAEFDAETGVVTVYEDVASFANSNRLPVRPASPRSAPPVRALPDARGAGGLKRSLCVGRGANPRPPVAEERPHDPAPDTPRQCVIELGTSSPRTPPTDASLRLGRRYSTARSASRAVTLTDPRAASFASSRTGLARPPSRLRAGAPGARRDECTSTRSTCRRTPINREASMKYSCGVAP